MGSRTKWHYWLLILACCWGPAFGRRPALSSEDLERKKEGWYPLGLPFANGNTDFGFGAGGGLYLFNGGTRSNTSGELDTEFTKWPYLCRIGLQLYFTTLGQQKHFLNLDVPRLGSDRFALWAELAWWTTLAENYFGIGGQSPGPVSTPGYQQVSTETPYGVLRLTSGLVGDLAVVTSVKMRHARIVSRSNAKRDDGLVIGSTLFDEQKPIGAEGGWANSLSLGLVFDQRDFAPWPQKGILAQILYDGYPTGFSDHVFGRTSADVSGYCLLGKNWVLAGHLAASELLGNAPFWEYARLGGNDRNRGFVDRRFVDRSALYFNVEGRWRVFSWRIKREQFHLSLVPFLDGGQVAPNLASPLLFAPWHFSAGLEMILTWNLATHLNITSGFSSEGFAFALDTRVMF